MPIRRSPGCKCCPGGTQVQGTLLGCGNIGLPHGRATFKVSGSEIGHLDADASGNYSGKVNISGAAQTVQVVGNASADPALDPFGPRFGTSSAITVTLNSAGTNTVPTITVPAAGTFHCSGLVYYPLGDLHLTDSFNGSFLLQWDVTRNTWFLQTSLSYAGCATFSCAGSGANKVVFGYQIFNGNTLQGFYGYNTAAGNCPSTFSNSTQVTSSNALTVTSINPFNATASLAAGNGSRWYCGNATTFTITE